MDLLFLKDLFSLYEQNNGFITIKAMNISRHTFWNEIDKLEADLKLILIDRKQGKLTFTPAGKIIIEQLKTLVMDYDNLKTFSRHLGAFKTPPLTISTTEAVAISWLMPCVLECNRRYPASHINVVSSNKVGKLDVPAIDIMFRPLADDLFVHRKWYITYQHALYAQQSYIHAMGMPQTPESLLDHKIIAFGSEEFTGFDQINWHINGEWGLPKLEPSIAINNTTAIYQAALAGHGICSASIEGNTYYQGDLVRVLPKITGPVAKSYFAWRQDIQDAKLAQAAVFEQVFKEYLESLHIKIFKSKEGA